MKKWCLLTLMLFVIFITGCKKDSEDFQATQMQLQEKLLNLGIPEVMKDSDNPNAQLAEGYYDQVMSVGDYMDWFDLPDDATHDGDNYYWSYGGLSLWEVYGESGTGYTRNVYIKTTDTDKLKYLQSEESKDGNSGYLYIYNYLSDANELLYTFDWTFDSQGNMTMTEEFADGSYSYEIQSNIDLSGSSKLYFNGILYNSFIWNTDGSGSNTYYDENGNVISTESWTVADL